jgi:hypothetical protein
VSISAVYGSQTTIQHSWGFLTRQRNYGSAAMRIQTVGSVIAGQYGQWPPSVGSVFASGLAVTYPQSVSWDLSFELLSSKSGWGSGGSSGSSGLYGDANQDGKVTMDDMAAMINVLLGGPVFK